MFFLISMLDHNSLYFYLQLGLCQILSKMALKVWISLHANFLLCLLFGSKQVVYCGIDQSYLIEHRCF